MNRFIALISGLLLTALSFSIFPQGKPDGNPPYVIDIAGNLKNHRVFKLSEIATDVSYVRLETRPDVLIGYGTIKPAGKYMAMLEMIDALDENDNPVIMIVKLKGGLLK
jgi:hypothetical protein